MAPAAPVAEVDTLIWEAVRRELEDPELVDSIVEIEQQRAGEHHDWSRDVEAARAHLARLERVEAGMLARYRQGAIGDVALDSELAHLRREREMARQQLETATRAAASMVGAADRAAQLRISVDAIRARLDVATVAERQELVGALVAPGGAQFNGRQVRLTMFVDVGAAAARPAGEPVALRVVQEDGELTRPVALSHLKIRVLVGGAGRRCACGRELPDGASTRQIHCSDACNQAAWRGRDPAGRRAYQAAWQRARRKAG